MRRSSTSLGLGIGVLAALAFGMSGAFSKPLLEAGWSPAAAVTVRALAGGLVILPFALIALRGRWATVWTGRWRIAAMGGIGVAGTQLVYFASLQRIPVSTTILIEYMAPVLLVLFVWATTRRVPRVVVLIGSVVSIGGMVLVVSPGADAPLDLLGLILAGLATVGCAIYYVVAARPAEGLPPVALASFGLLLGGTALGAVGLTGLLPLTATFDTVIMAGEPVAWWVPVALVAVIATGFSYVASITAAGMLGSRLASFVGLIEVVAAAFYAWVLLGEELTLWQLLGGVLILVGIGFVKSEKEHPEPGVAEPELAAAAAAER
ncbi:MAG TPA: DMT family transporter [Pseudolysinimonas sp.]|nr:DMT family transporter [Pseudolysinimonas sp.]